MSEQSPFVPPSIAPFPPASSSFALPRASADGPASVTVFASPSSWIESDAVDQCHQVAALDGMLHIAGMPDLHPGKGAPIGTAMTSTVVYPHLVGSDIGCGIAVFPIALRRPVPERLAARFPDLDQPLDPDRDADDPAWDAVCIGSPDDVPAGHPQGLGTVGRGNHFVELARIASTPDAARALGLGLATGDLMLLVHSGSRGLGERVLRAHTERHGAGPAPDPAAYLAAHDEAVRWAALNRAVIAARVAHALGATPTAPVVDVCHNLVQHHDGGMAAPQGRGSGRGGGPGRRLPRDPLLPGGGACRGGGEPLDRSRGRAQDVARPGPAARPGQAHGRRAAPYPAGVARRVRGPAAAVRGGTRGLQADRPGHRRPCRARLGHPDRHDRPPGHLQDRRQDRRPAQAPEPTLNRPATDHPATDPPAHNRPAHNDGRADRVDLLLSAGRGPQECA